MTPDARNALAAYYESLMASEAGRAYPAGWLARERDSVLAGAMPNHDVQVGALSILQGGRCGACSRAFLPGDPPLRLDHDHETALTRGLLCHSCNVQEGKDASAPHLVAYLADPPARDFGWIFQDARGDWAQPLPLISEEEMRRAARSLRVPYAGRGEE